MIARPRTPDYGSNVRLAAVLTDLPMAVDQPRDIGVNDLCAHCRICETNCPPHAVFPEKQLVCIEVCPWSTPGKGPVEPPETDVCHVGCRCGEPA